MIGAPSLSKLHPSSSLSSLTSTDIEQNIISAPEESLSANHILPQYSKISHHISNCDGDFAKSNHSPNLNHKQLEHSSTISSSQSKSNPIQNHSCVSAKETPWSSSESRLFFELFKTHGCDWSQYKSNLPQRTNDMLETIYIKHRTYLCLQDSNCDIFVSMMKDHNEACEFENNVRLSRSVNSSDAESYPPPPQSLPKDTSCSSAASALTSATMTSDRSGAKSTDTEQHGDCSNDSHYSNICNTPLYQQSTSRICQEFEVSDRLRKRGRRLFSEDRDPSISDSTSFVDGHDLTVLQSRLRNAVSNDHFLRWIKCEWFYSSIDKHIFKASCDFERCLEDIGLSSICTMTKFEWNYIRRKMGKPRRLSNSFLLQERRKLAKQRAQIRLIQQGGGAALLSLTSDQHHLRSLCHDADLPEEIPTLLSVGQEVLAYCPVSPSLPYQSQELNYPPPPAFPLSSRMYRSRRLRPAPVPRTV